MENNVKEKNDNFEDEVNKIILTKQRSENLYKFDLIKIFDKNFENENKLNNNQFKGKVKGGEKEKEKGIINIY